MKIIPGSSYKRKEDGVVHFYRVMTLGKKVESKFKLKNLLKQKPDRVVYSDWTKSSEVFIDTCKNFAATMTHIDNVISPTEGMSVKERIEHEKGTVNEDGTVTFPNVHAVVMYSNGILRDHWERAMYAEIE